MCDQILKMRLLCFNAAHWALSAIKANPPTSFRCWHDYQMCNNLINKKWFFRFLCLYISTPLPAYCICVGQSRCQQRDRAWWHSGRKEEAEGNHRAEMCRHTCISKLKSDLCNNIISGFGHSICTRSSNKQWSLDQISSAWRASAYMPQTLQAACFWLWRGVYPENRSNHSLVIETLWWWSPWS